MADNKKYYYLKLKEDFFESDEAVVLESMPDGYIYSNILLKLYLRSLKNNGLLMFNNIIPYNSQMLATITRHQVGTVERAVQIFKDLQLIDILDNGAIYMTNIQNFVGKSSTDADRKRLARANGQMSTIGVEKSPPEIEKDIEIELDKELESEKDISSSSCINNKELIKRFEKEFGRLLSPYEIERVIKWVTDDNYLPDVIIEALKEAIFKGKPNLQYIQGILRNWKNDNLTTVELIEANRRERENSHSPKNVQASAEFIEAMDLWKDKD